MTTIISTITPELIAVALGFALRHILMPYFSGKETSNLIKYIKQHEITKEQKAELSSNLAEARLWIEVHSDSCPYVKKRLREAKQELSDIITKGNK